MKKLFFLLFMISFSFGGFIDGNELYSKGLEYYKDEIGRRGNYFDIGFYDGYVVGVVDAYDYILFCPPRNVRAGQVLDIVFKYLQNHPEIRNWPANRIVVKAIAEIWPCRSRR